MAEQLVMNINVDELARANSIINSIRTYYNSKIVGQSQLGVSLLVSMIANGHILLESVPGLAKTTAAKVMKGMLEGSKELTFLEPVVTIRSAMTPENEAQLEALAEALCAC